MDKSLCNITLPIFVPSQSLTHLAFISFSSYLNKQSITLMSDRGNAKWLWECTTDLQVKDKWETYAQVSHQWDTRLALWQHQNITCRFLNESKASQELTPVARRPKKTSPLLVSTNALTAASVILFLPETSKETKDGRTWGLPSRSCCTISSTLLPSLKWSFEKSRCLMAWSWVSTKSSVEGDISSCPSWWAIKDFSVFLQWSSGVSFETAQQETSSISRWGRVHMSSRTSSFRSVLARLSFLKPCRVLKPTQVPSPFFSVLKSRHSPFKDNLCRLVLHSGFEARPERILAPVRPPETQETSSSWSRWGQRARRNSWADTVQRRMEALRRRSSLQFRKIPIVVLLSIPGKEKQKNSLKNL